MTEPQKVTMKDVREWAALAEKAMPEPWNGTDCPIDEFWAELYPEDRAFVASSRAAVPALCAEIERLNRELLAARQSITYRQNDDGGFSKLPRWYEGMTPEGKP